MGAGSEHFSLLCSTRSSSGADDIPKLSEDLLKAQQAAYSVAGVDEEVRFNTMRSSCKLFNNCK